MSRTVDLLVLCEDVQARVFILDALETVDLHLLRRVRVIPCPGQVFRDGESGTRMVQGWTVHACGSQHVRENYPDIISQRRSRTGRSRTMGCRTIVHIDVDNERADGRTVLDRRNELTKTCEQRGVTPPDATEPVAHLIPRRNIETWIRFFLEGHPLDEHTAYPHLARESDASPAAQAFATHARNNTQPEGALPSLRTGIIEFRRVL